MPHPVRTSLLVVAALAAAAGAAALGRPGAPGTSARPVAAPNAAPHAAAPSLPRGASAAAARVVAAYYADLAALDAAAAALARAAAAPAPPDSARAAFRRARLAYKRAEALAEYYAPRTARAVNGPAIPHAEDDAPSIVIPPTGFQVAEAALFPDTAPGWRALVREQALMLRPAAGALRRASELTAPTDLHVFDALRAEVARVGTLGVAGFDASLSGDALRESAEALRGVRATLLAWPGSAVPNDAYMAARAAAAARLAGAAAYLDAHPDAERSDRLAFLAGHLVPAARALDAARRATGVALDADGRAWARAAASPYERGAFDARAYAPPGAPAATPALVALGGRLFADSLLSGDGTRACASCHQPTRGYADGRARRVGRDGAHDATGRNTPTVLHVGLQPGSFWDQRTTYLEDQVTDVMRNRAEMRHAVDAAAAGLAGRPGYRAAFARAFGEVPAPAGGPADSAVTAARLRSALAAYLRTLGTLDTRVDRALRGEPAALSAAERRGFTVFMGKGKCGTCHFAPLFNGVTPPGYTEAEPEVIGVPAAASGPGRRRVDPDVGRYAVDRIAMHRHAFKTPTLRDVARTAPYMHNGVFRTLAEVVDFYDRGGGAGLGIALPNQTLPPERLRLTRREKRDLVGFMEALSDGGPDADASGRP